MRDIADYFTLEPASRRIEDLETPVPLVDLGIVERNLRRWQERCETLKLRNRPHIKTHKLVPLARYQLDLGAQGITVQKLGEAETMADAGISDMLLTFNVVGATKLKRLAALARRTAISVVADSAEVVAGLGEAGKSAGRDIAVLVECDTGAGRNGAQSPEAAAALARLVERTEGVGYRGLMTYPRAGGRAVAAEFLRAAKTAVAAAGLDTAILSAGGSPDMWNDEGLEGLDEYRAGTYIYFDRSLAERGACAYADCAVTVLSTIVSTPTPQRALIDAGSKALTSDQLGLKGFGAVQEMGLAQVYDVSEEHGFLDISAVAAKPRVGDLVRVTPNHVCPVSNLYDKVALIRGGEVLGLARVDARGKVQ